MTRRDTRRHILQLGLGGAVGLAAAPAIIRRSAAAEPLSFLTLSQYTGTYGYAGPLVTNGAQLALEMHGNEILGDKIRFVHRDDEGKAAVGVRRLTEAIDSDHVTFFNGNYSSNVGLAESEIAKRHKILQYAAGGSEDFTGSRCSRYTFQWSAAPYTALKAVMDYVQKTMPDAKRWYTITADYVFGQSLLKYAREVAKEKGIEIVGNDNVPLGERQFNQYLTKAIASRPQVLCLLNGGSDAVNAVRQFYGYGAKGIQVVAPWAIEVDEMKELAPEMRAGIILGENYYHTIDNPVNKEFVSHYEAKYKSPPAYASAYGYDSFRTILLAMKKANSTKVADVIKTMEGMKYDSVLGPTHIDAETHQTVRPYYVVKGKAEKDMKSATDYADIVHVGADPQPKKLNECKGLGPL